MIWLVPVGLVALVWLVGAAKKEASRPIHRRGAGVVGIAALLALLGLLWRRRGLVLDGVAVSILLLFGGGLLAAFLLADSTVTRLRIAAPAIVGGCVGLVVWDWSATRGRPWRELVALRRREDDVRRAVADTHPDARVGSVRVRGGTVEAHVEHVGPVDVERVGQVLHAPHTTLEPTAEMGRARVVVHAAAPPAEVDPWQALSVVHRWPGVSSTDPDALIPVAVDVHGRWVPVPVPGEGGKHLLVAGSTGAGKSVFLSVVLAELAYRDVELRLADPKLVEFGAWLPRASVARGVDETGAMLDAVHDEMMSRYQSLQAAGRRQWTGRKLILVIDELSAVTTGGKAAGAGGRIQKLGLILAMGRAAGVGLVLCTQRPSKDVIPLDLRDNTRVRVGLGCESQYQTEMILGDQTRWPCHEIPESLPGTAYVRVDRHASLCRSFLLTDDDVDRVAAATAHLKGA